MSAASFVAVLQIEAISSAILMASPIELFLPKVTLMAPFSYSGDRFKAFCLFSLFLARAAPFMARFALSVPPGSKTSEIKYQEFPVPTAPPLFEGQAVLLFQQWPKMQPFPSSTVWERCRLDLKLVPNRNVPDILSS